MINVTADTNIYISALQFGGVPGQFLLAARRRRFELAISSPILNETQRVLHEKFSWTDEMRQLAASRLSRITTLVHPTRTLSVIVEDPDDDRILECAVAARSQFIVSGDNHLLRLGSHDGIQIIKVADFLARLPTL